MIALPAGGHERLREVVRRLVDPPADQGDGAARIEGVTGDRLLVPLARLVQRHIQPPQSFVVPPQPHLRAPVQQREARGIHQLGLGSRAEVLHDLGVVSGGGEVAGLVDYE